jgi:diguanylate cyclase (GGDEF)-like protein
MSAQPARGDAAEDAKRQFCCSMTKPLIALVRREGGERAVAELLREAQSPYEASYLEDTNNWISLAESSALLEAGVRVTGDPSFALKVGEETVRQQTGTQVATLLRSLGSVEADLQAVAQAAGRFTTVTEMEALEVEPGRALLRAAARPGFRRTRLHCDVTKGLLAGNPILFGMPLAHVHESECQSRGDAQCLYTVTWDAEIAASAADPQQRVTALESQLKSVSERLHGVYAVAGDLVSTEDVETVLRRIVERAADAVRAPSHVLAVRPDPSADLQIYSHGMSSDAATTLARRTLAGEEYDGESTLVVEVASSRRAYGQLIAHFPGQIEFFPQEREMLGLYAKHAAAVLDIALALQESAQRHAQVSSLLSLSHAMAEAGSSHDVAERLAAAVPEVIDCDRIAVWLWDEDKRHLAPVASWNRAQDSAFELSDVRISPADTPNLASMLVEPAPHFFVQGTDDVFVGRLMAEIRVIALTVVPIIARDVFQGILTVSVADNAQRLRPDSELLERLTGVAALAAPAIQNGHLVDQLRHKASHDGLTGLLNRVGFKQRIDTVLEGARSLDGHAGLLFVDLNEFKRVNDMYGHEAGDELIRQAAARLSGACRSGDEVARLGGDEFAVILAEVERDDQVHAAERRIRAAFAEQFIVDGIQLSVGASVGGGLWPRDGSTVTELVRHADAAMYVDKSQSRRASADIHAGVATMPANDVR